MHPYRHAPVDILEERLVAIACDEPPIIEETEFGFVLRYSYRFKLEMVKVPMEDLNINVDLRPKFYGFFAHMVLGMFLFFLSLGITLELGLLFL